MRKSILFFAALVLTSLMSSAVWAGGDRVVVRAFAAVKFATLPDDVNFPEGIAANPYNGDIYVSTFNFGGNNQLLRFNRAGRLEESLSFGGAPLLGLAFNKEDNNVYIANFGLGAIQRVDASFDNTVETVATGFSAPNGMVFDDSGTLFISDSAGSVSKVENAHLCGGMMMPCTVVLVVQDMLLETSGFPPFGANGLALGNGDSTLYVANTGDDRVLSIDLATLSISVFAESINGADGLAVDREGHLWVAANQADQAVALNHQGRVIAELGEFHGIRHDGSVRGLLFPASIAIVGRKMFVTNLALPLQGSRGASPSEPEADVTRDTISMIIIPRL